MTYVIYEDLEVYKQARKLLIELHKSSLNWAKYEQYGGLADQARRSSRSIVANLAEGLSKNTSIADKCKFIQISIGSAEETRVWADLACEFGYISSEECVYYRTEYKKITRMLSGLEKSIRKG